MTGDAEQEQSIPSQTTLEENPEAWGAEKGVTQEIIEPARVLAPEQPDQSNKEAPQEQNYEVSHSPSHSEQPTIPFKEIKEL